MNTYKIYFEEAFDVIIEAKDEDEAREKFMQGEYENKPNYREITGFDIVKWTNKKEV